MARNGLQTATVLLTSAINVSAPRTALSEPSRRLEETLKSIEMWRRMPGVGKIVLCDGSGFDFPMIALGSRDGADVEVLSFTNDVEEVGRKGKGYGEGQIVSHALAHSRFLSTESVFAKCTGKLWVSNFRRCLRGFNGVAAFDYAGWLQPTSIDTRFYIVQKSFYLDVLSDAHVGVDDSRGIYLEHVFAQALAAKKLASYAMSPTPRIEGVSGSMGVAYETREMKAKCRDLRSWIARNIPA